MPDAGAVQRALRALAVAEKARYPFKNYRRAGSEGVLFVGCNVASLYPRTVREAARVLREAAGIGIVYDCCGAPLLLEGSAGGAARVAAGVARRLRARGVREVVATCPTCAATLRDVVDAQVVNVYAKLRELGLGRRLPPDGAVFPPCPDRRDGAWLADVLSFFDGEPPVLSKAPCCGLGENAGLRDAGAARAMARACVGHARDAAEGAPYVYCASCAGSFAANGAPRVRYVLSELLGVSEPPAVGSSLANRALAKLA